MGSLLGRRLKHPLYSVLWTQWKLLVQRICNHGNRDPHLQCMVEVTICGMLDTNGSNSSTSVGDGIRGKTRIFWHIAQWTYSTGHCSSDHEWFNILGGGTGVREEGDRMHGGRGERGGRWDRHEHVRWWEDINVQILTMATPTCTMIPFELYSLRRASEKWLSNLCRREDGEMIVGHFHSYTQYLTKIWSHYPQ